MAVFLLIGLSLACSSYLCVDMCTSRSHYSVCSQDVPQMLVPRDKTELVEKSLICCPLCWDWCSEKPEVVRAVALGKFKAILKERESARKAVPISCFHLNCILSLGFALHFNLILNVVCISCIWLYVLL